MMKYWIIPLVLCGISGGNAYGNPTDLEEVVSIGSRSEKPLKDQSGNVAVIGVRDISAIQATHIAELTSRIAGINFSRNDGQEYLSSIRSPILTGAGSCGAFLMTQDGIPLRSSGFCNANELFEAFTEQAERIEVMRGPASALYGSNALHGMINVITPPANTDNGHMSVEGGANDFIRFNFSKGVLVGQHGLRLMSSITHDGGYREDSGYDQQKINLRHDYKGDIWDISTALMLTNLDQETAGYITGFEAYKDRAISKTNPNPEAFRKAKSLRYWSKFSADIKDELRLQLTPYFRALDMKFLMHFIPGQPLEENSQTSIGLQSGLYFNEGGNVEIITGADVEYTRGVLRQTQDKPTEGSAFLRATIPMGKHYDYDVDSIMAAAFVQTDIAITSKLHLVMGARLDYMRYDYNNNMIAGRSRSDGTLCGFGGCRYSRPESRIDDFTSLSPKIGLLYHFQNDHDFYLNIDHGFRAPQATELYRLQGNQNIANLGRENLQSLSFGFRGGRDSFTYDISFYAMKKDHYIFQDSSSFNVDNGKSDHLGTDVMVKFDVNEHLSVRANMSLARHRYKFDYVSNGINLMYKDIDSAPHNFGSMQIIWHLSDDIMTEFEWAHMGSYFLDPENLHRYEGHDYFNLRANFKVTEKAKLFLRIMNIADIKYAERADYTSFTHERYFPGKPRSFYLGTAVNF
ncbi:MAG: TonB-dependent receptor [Emcibacter sp.]|nr:TonB-dependent receptor [Emcibacter sp.]